MDNTGTDYKCTWAQNIQQAIEVLQYLRPDLILVDETDAPALLLQLDPNSNVGVLYSQDPVTKLPAIGKTYSIYLSVKTRISWPNALLFL